MLSFSFCISREALQWRSANILMANRPIDILEKCSAFRAQYIFNNTISRFLIMIIMLINECMAWRHFERNDLIYKIVNELKINVCQRCIRCTSLLKYKIKWMTKYVCFTLTFSVSETFTRRNILLSCLLFFTPIKIFFIVEFVAFL